MATLKIIAKDPKIKGMDISQFITDIVKWDSSVSREDVEKAYEAGAKAVLVSKSIEQAQDPFDKLQKLNGLS